MFYKQSVQNISFFNKDTIYTIRQKQMVGGIRYYWIKSPLADLPMCFSRSELFAVRSNFM